MLSCNHSDLTDPHERIVKLWQQIDPFLKAKARYCPEGMNLTSGCYGWLSTFLHAFLIFQKVISLIRQSIYFCVFFFRILNNLYNSKICTLCLTYRCSRLFFQRKQKTVSRVLGREESVQVTILSKHL